MSSGRRDVRFTSAPGIDLTASVWGDDDTSGVLLLHGLSQQRLFWGPVISRLHATAVASLDQRGHGMSDTPVDADYSVGACAGDVVACLDALGWRSAFVVGHSWGASVALRAAAVHSDRVQAAALIDGGLWSPAGLGPRDEVRARLTPPTLGIPAEDLWSRVRSGDLGSTWTHERQQALELTFVTDDQGLLRSRLGLERHMLVLDGLLDVDPEVDLEACEASGTPVWAVVCEERGLTVPVAGDLKSDAAARAAERSNVLVHRWAGAIHDVPLQWPDLVAGFIDTVASSGRPADGLATGGGA